ncbi:integrase catalytic domain-containing protein [Trichonephila clavata]|uniref:Integrase catalytic domain-containing protein n=1 Tax=Trichonephila clavata TaxID=2740835 RepID=A0A8X6FYW1_TRICU|nr:integrase catalytic domain-containing protein [Trichonephila clavata]
MEVNDQKNICLGISKINDFRVLQKLATLNIFISDSSTNNKLCLFEKYSDEIHILLGSDIVGKLFIGEVKQLSEGLTAVNTRLGWTVMGKLSNKSKFKSDNSYLVHSLLTNREKISDLWEIDSLGIKDPSEKRSKLELQDLTLKHFENTVLRDDEGRYIVSIPWIEGSEKLENHYSLAKGRLEKTVKTVNVNLQADYLIMNNLQSNESFLLGLRRFIARRGRSSIICSDNGNNFKGAYQLLQKVNLEQLKNLEKLNPNSWKFIPPQAPWWGGFWDHTRRINWSLGKTLPWPRREG